MSGGDHPGVAGPGHELCQHVRPPPPSATITLGLKPAQIRTPLAHFAAIEQLIGPD
jgi:hypothetical protein